MTIESYPLVLTWTEHAAGREMDHCPPVPPTRIHHLDQDIEEDSAVEETEVDAAVAVATTTVDGVEEEAITTIGTDSANEVALMIGQEVQVGVVAVTIEMTATELTDTQRTWIGSRLATTTVRI